MPRRKEHASDLSWKEVDLIRGAMGITVPMFCRNTGINKRRYQRSIKGESGHEDVPLIIEFVLMLYELRPDFRHMDDRLPFPFNKYGIDIEVVEDVTT
jgi:hypothetical protein